MYASNIGTFLQRDPLALGADTTLGYSHASVSRLLRNLTNYVDNRPTANVDPYRLEAYCRRDYGDYDTNSMRIAHEIAANSQKYKQAMIDAFSGQKGILLRLHMQDRCCGNRSRI